MKTSLAQITLSAIQNPFRINRLRNEIAALSTVETLSRADWSEITREFMRATVKDSSAVLALIRASLPNPTIPLRDACSKTAFAPIARPMVAWLCVNPVRVTCKKGALSLVPLSPWLLMRQGVFVACSLSLTAQRYAFGIRVNIRQANRL